MTTWPPIGCDGRSTPWWTGRAMADVTRPATWEADAATKELVGEEDLFERGGPYAVRVNDEFTFDVMPSACGHSWAELERFIERRDVGGVVLPVLGLEGLLLTKEGMRDKD